MWARTVAGLNLYNPATGLFDRVPVGQQPLTILAMERVGDELWLATYMQGIYVSEHYKWCDTPLFERGSGFWTVERRNFCIRQDRRGKCGIGTNGKGVQVYVPGKKVFQRLSDFLAGAGGDKRPETGFIRAIEEDSEGKIWMAVPGRGVDMYDPGDQYLLALWPQAGPWFANRRSAMPAGGEGWRVVGWYRRQGALPPIPAG